jgi:signal transduction histidine kinase
VLEKLRENRRIPEQADFQSFKKSQADLFHRLLEPKQELLHLPDERTLKLMIIPNPLGGLMFSYEDVTDRLALERNYKTLHAVQQATLDNLFEGIAVFGSDGKLRLSNPAASTMWSIPLDVLSGTSPMTTAEVLERIQPFFVKQDKAAAYWGKVKRRLLSVLQERKVRHGRLRRTDSSIVDYTVMPLPDGSTMLSFVDVTATANIEAALIERNQALEKAELLKSQFIAHVSYELRTPLNSIMGFAEMVQTGMAGALNPKQQEYMTDILSSAHHLQQLIDDVIDLATIEAGYVTLTKERCLIREVLAELLAAFKKIAADKGVSFTVTGLNEHAVVDAKRLRQLVQNLVQNAVQYTPEGGVITLAFASVLDKLEIVVTDTGIGIAEEDQQRIFAKFERGKSLLTATGRGGGSGLGLALVQEIVALHGGVIQLESAVGKGTTVRCVLA